MGKETRGAATPVPNAEWIVRCGILSAGLAACGIAGLALSDRGNSPDTPGETMSSAGVSVRETMVTARVVARAPARTLEGQLRPLGAAPTAPPATIREAVSDGLEDGAGPEEKGPFVEPSQGSAPVDEPQSSEAEEGPARHAPATTLPPTPHGGIEARSVAPRPRPRPRAQDEHTPGRERSRSAPLNVETRALGASIALGELRRLRDLEGDRSQDAVSTLRPQRADGDSQDAEPVPEAPDGAGDRGPEASGSDSLEISERRLLFVWDSSIVLDADRSRELMEFAARRGFDSLAVEATGVGYHDAALTSAFTSFVSEARGYRMETLALVGYPWFAVSADAGLPGQPTSSEEGLELLRVIRDTGLFDGVVDDSHSYGVRYEVDGESRNYLFDEPAAASLDMQSWLRSAKDVLGETPLLKTTPFWFDSHPDLGEVVDLDGQGHVSLGHLVAAEVDTTVVLAYRDELLGPNGVLELAAGELAMGPAIIALETGDLGPGLEYLTFHEEGLLPLMNAMEGIDSALGGQWSFGGLAVHHYDPLQELARQLSNAQSFGFIGHESVNVEYGALVDAYDSSRGRYYDQMVFQPAIGVVAGFGAGAIVSNGPISLGSGALIFGDARAGAGESVRQASGVKLTGEAISLSDPAPMPEVQAIDPTTNTKVRVGWNSQGILSGDQSLKEIRLSGYASLDIKGPAHVVVDNLRLSDYAWIFADVTDGPVKITVNKKLELGVAAWIAPTSLQARDLSMDYASSGSIEMKRESRLLTDLKAPLAEVVVGQDAEIYGRARARKIRVENKGQLHLDVDLSTHRD